MPSFFELADEWLTAHNPEPVSLTNVIKPNNPAGLPIDAGIKSVIDSGISKKKTFFDLADEWLNSRNNDVPLGEDPAPAEDLTNIVKPHATTVADVVKPNRSSQARSAKNPFEGLMSDIKTAKETISPLIPAPIKDVIKGGVLDQMAGTEEWMKMPEDAPEKQGIRKMANILSTSSMIGAAPKAVVKTGMDGFNFASKAFQLGSALGIVDKNSQELKALADSLSKGGKAIEGAEDVAKILNNEAKKQESIAKYLENAYKVHAGEEPSAIVAQLAKENIYDLTGKVVEGPDALSSATPGKGIANGGKLPGGLNSEQYVQKMIKERESARKTATLSVPIQASNFFRELKTKLVDFNAPIEDVFIEMQKKGGYEILPEYNITNQIDRALRSPTLAGRFAEDNGLTKIIQSTDNLENLDQYLIAKHAPFLEDRGFSTGRNKILDSQLVKDFAPKYEPIAKEVNAYSRKLLDYAVDSGLINKDLAKKLKEIYPDYIPMNRVFEEAGKTDGHFGSAGVANLSEQTILQRLQGSDRHVDNPLIALMSKTNDAFRQGEKNKTARILAGFKDLPGNPFGLRELKSGETSVSKINFLDNGVKRSFEAPHAIVQAAKALNVQQLNVIERILAFPIRVAKFGITGAYIPFTLSNVVRDQAFTFMTSREAFQTSMANPNNLLRSLFSVLKHDELYDEMVRAGAGGTSFDLARNQAEKTIGQIRSEKNIGSKIAYTARHPSQILRAVEDIIGRSEELTRMTQYRGTKVALQKKGMNEADATINAAIAARENSANFYRRGEYGQVLNSMFLYLNAGIQGSRSMVKAFGRQPVETAGKVALTLLMPTAIATLWNVSDPKRLAAYKDIAEYEKKGNLIIIPPNPTRDGVGKWNVIKIPLAYGVGGLAYPVRKGIEQANDIDSIKVSEMANNVIGSLSPINPDMGSIASTLTPQAIKPAIEAYTNRNMFTNLPIVPERMKNLSPENQTRPGTSGTARILAKPFNASPLKVEAFLKGTAGGFAMNVLNASDTALNAAGIIPKDQIGGEDIPEGMSRRFTKATGGEIERKQIEEIMPAITAQADEKVILAAKAENLWEELNDTSIPVKEREKKLSEIPTDSDLYKALSDISDQEQLGLTVYDRMLKQLSVKDGSRANFIVEKIANMKASDGEDLLNSLIKKKIITQEVRDQISELIPQIIERERQKGNILWSE